jgi:hypothetical protein
MGSSPILELAARLAPRDARVLAKVRVASDPELAWEALVDALQARGRLLPIDHRSFPDTVMFAIDELSPRRGRFAWAHALEKLDEIGTADFLSRAAKRMRREEKKTIVSLESAAETDTFLVVVVASAGVAKLAALVSRAGHELVDFAKWKPPARAKPKKKASPRAAPTKPRAPRTKRMYWRKFRRGESAVDLWVYPLGFDVHRDGARETRLFDARETAASALDAFVATIERAGYAEDG